MNINVHLSLRENVRKEEVLEDIIMQNLNLEIYIALMRKMLNSFISIKYENVFKTCIY